MATRLILNEFDLNLSALATGLVIIIVVVVGAHARALGAAVVSGAVTGGLLQVVLSRRRVLLTDGSDVGHDETRGRLEWREKRSVNDENGIREERKKSGGREDECPKRNDAFEGEGE